MDWEPNHLRISASLCVETIGVTLKGMSAAHPHEVKPAAKRAKSSFEAEIKQIFQELGEFGKALIIERAKRQAESAGRVWVEHAKIHPSNSHHVEAQQRSAQVDEVEASPSTEAQFAEMIRAEKRRHESEWAMAPMYERLERKIQRFEARFSADYVPNREVTGTRPATKTREPVETKRYAPESSAPTLPIDPTMRAHDFVEDADFPLTSADAAEVSEEVAAMSADATEVGEEISATSADDTDFSKGVAATRSEAGDLSANILTTEPATAASTTQEAGSRSVETMAQTAASEPVESDPSAETTATQTVDVQPPTLRRVDQDPFVQSWRSIKRFFRRLTDMDLLLFTSSTEMFRVFLAMLRALTPYYQGPSMSMDDLMKMGTAPA